MCLAVHHPRLAYPVPVLGRYSFLEISLTVCVPTYSFALPADLKEIKVIHKNQVCDQEQSSSCLGCYREVCKKAISATLTRLLASFLLWTHKLSPALVPWKSSIYPNCSFAWRHPFIFLVCISWRASVCASQLGHSWHVSVTPNTLCCDWIQSSCSFCLLSGCMCLCMYASDRYPFSL